MRDSRILEGNAAYFNQMYQWLTSTAGNWRLCWRATIHGWAAKEFHARCNYKVPTVTVIQVGQYVFGGFADKTWEGIYTSVFLMSYLILPF